MDGEAEGRRIILHPAEHFAGMREAGRLAALTLDMITPHVKLGVTTGELDRLIHEFTLDHHATPATLNYRGYPKSSCISINTWSATGYPAIVGCRKATSSISMSPRSLTAGTVTAAGCMWWARYPAAPRC